MVSNLVEVFMPQFGESVDEAFIVRWIKSVGESVEEHEALVEVNTDKIDVEVPSPASGILTEILVPAGTTIQAGSVVALISADEANQGTSIIAPEEQPQGNKPVQTKSTIKPGRHRELGFISPVVARLSSEVGIDLRKVTGSGLDGRITKQDVLTYLDSKNIVPVPEQALTDGDEIVPLSPLRRAIATRMSLSKQTIPHVTTLMEADLSRVIAHRKAHKDDFLKTEVNLTYTAYFTAATVQALLMYPMVNASWSEEGIILHRGIHIGMAVSLGDAGLVVPVIKDSAGKTLLELARSISELSALARSGRLKPEDVQSATFSITNHGVSGSLFAIPAINPPQCAILGVGAAQKRVVVIEDEFGEDSIAVRPMVYLSLTFDHRILDGAIADHFLGKVVNVLEGWS